MGDENPIYLNDSAIKKLLSWDTLIPTVENVLSAISNKDESESIQPPRLLMPIPSRHGVMLCMPSFCGSQNIFGFKVVSSFPKNIERGLPSINGLITLLDSETGRVKMMLEANEITAWRTAAASAVATKHMYKGEKKVLAILGAGVQGKSHALAMQHLFQFSEVRIWNRTFERAKVLCAELGNWAKPFESIELCVQGANVIVTTTYASESIIDMAWLQTGAHINAVGANRNHYSELPLDVYKHSTVVVDAWDSARNELRGLIDSGIELFCELGELIREVKRLPGTSKFTIFQSLGMSLEDIATAKLIYNQVSKAK
ncbi:ketimine reductase mu-crystallin-like [Homalodisca vitripennis]|uniref:ketimine reductase mu-crystallin-like n=1 Tax=Homalodisca vitripennis TaxID=197043 RepID=UPI001EEC7EE1|nr:ketimine reductase mu-crystallin-like [Homalodisca vitripennis]